ncbi:RNA-directed DNA polymerase, eukaryota [Tanacetum coccineum]
MSSRFRSNEDGVRSISRSIFVTNFPDSTTAKDLWKICQGYGSVVDVFIPNRKSKAGKRFAFVRFIRVGNIERLVGNISTLWIGRMHLQANVVRFERPPINTARPSFPSKPFNNGSSSFASVLKGNNLPHVISPSPAMVLDESCIVSRDLDLFVMGEAKNILSIPNLYILLSNEGFHNVKLSYLGGLWVMIELESINSKEKFMQHSGVASWFSNLCNAQLDFVSRNRIVWVDIEGVPIHAWSRATFNKIGSKWGEVMEIEECKDDLFARKRICIKTSQEDNIFEKFKIIVKGKVFVIRAKELFVWSPVFKVDNEATFFSDAESSKGSDEGKGDDVNKGMESDGEAVSDTYFGENSDNLNKEHDQVLSPKVVVSSLDPFNIYETLRKKSDKVLHNEPDSSIPFPPGFTPRNDNLNVDDQVVKDKTPVLSQRQSEGFCSRVMEDLHQDVDHSFSDNNSIGNKGHDSRKGGSILDVLDGMVKVGQAMGYDMDGCLKDMEKIIGSQGVPDLDQGNVNDDILLSRMNLMKQLHDIKSADSRDSFQKAKIKWAVEGDENSKFFHGIINRKRANLAIKGILADGDWIDAPCRVKAEFGNHFANRFRVPCDNRSRINFPFPNRLSSDQADLLEEPISSDEIRIAVWACGENKSPGPDGFTFEFFRRFWDFIGPDFCLAVKWFFDHSSFAKGCNSSFIALIPKVPDPKGVNDYRPISLIGSLYKVVTKILALRLSSVLDYLISEVQSAFLPNRQILDGPFIINDVLSWCKLKRHQAMIFKVDFAKAYDSVRWDFLDDVLSSFGFGSKWRSWILGSLSLGKASVYI